MTIKDSDGCNHSIMNNITYKKLLVKHNILDHITRLTRSTIQNLNKINAEDPSLYSNFRECCVGIDSSSTLTFDNLCIIPFVIKEKHTVGRERCKI